MDFNASRVSKVVIQYCVDSAPDVCYRKEFNTLYQFSQWVRDNQDSCTVLQYLARYSYPTPIAPRSHEQRLTEICKRGSMAARQITDDDRLF